MEFWICDFWNFQVLEFSIFGIFNFWFLEFSIFGICIFGICDFWNFNFLNFQFFELSIIGIFYFWNGRFMEFSKFGLFKFWNLWFWTGKRSPDEMSWKMHRQQKGISRTARALLAVKNVKLRLLLSVEIVKAERKFQHKCRDCLIIEPIFASEKTTNHWEFSLNTENFRIYVALRKSTWNALGSWGNKKKF